MKRKTTLIKTNIERGLKDRKYNDMYCNGAKLHKQTINKLYLFFKFYTLDNKLFILFNNIIGHVSYSKDTLISIKDINNYLEKK